MFWIDPTDNDQKGGTRAFQCDSPSDVPNLPTSTTLGKGDDETANQKVEKSSSCLCLGSGELYILNSEDEWISV